MDTETYTWRGVELPVWRFKTFAELEAFLDDLSPESYVAEIKPGFEKDDLTGLIFSKEPTVPANAVAVFDITHPEPA